VRSVFGGDPLTLDDSSLYALFDRLAASGVAGGATYDALIAETARSNGVRLVTLDRRAIRTYEIVGVDFSLLEAGAT
jgi:predicted nucleic acid-binding protein